MTDNKPKLYNELASWWPLLSSPDDYVDEANLYMRILCQAVHEPINTVLELGSGGGNNATHMKSRFNLTLVDMSEGMLACSRRLNPECEHIQADMRTVRLGRHFDAVFVHDAIMYMTTENDLVQAITTAFVHCKPGGIALFVPDCLKETFEQSTKCGGHDGEDRALRYLEWNIDPNPDDTSYACEFAYILRCSDGSTCVEHDHHELGLFRQADWTRCLTSVGFQTQVISLEYTDVQPARGFLCFRPSYVAAWARSVIS